MSVEGAKAPVGAVVALQGLAGAGQAEAGQHRRCDAPGGPMYHPPASKFGRRRDESAEMAAVRWGIMVRGERDRWIRLFTRLDAAVSRHRTAKQEGAFCDDADDALHAAHDRILKSAATSEPKGAAPLGGAVKDGG